VLLGVDIVLPPLSHRKLYTCCSLRDLGLFLKVAGIGSESSTGSGW
jgi:hypothetical protein